MEHLSEEIKLEAVRNVTDILSRTFSSQFVFPALGHNDPPPSKKLVVMWSQWLPTEALLSFETERIAQAFTHATCGLTYSQKSCNSLRVQYDIDFRVVLGLSRFIAQQARDILSSSMEHLSEEIKLEAVRNVTDILSRTFSSQFVFPALGHNDPPPSKKLVVMWSQWLPTEALLSFET
ncbi:jg23000, partial [Pararge aegeria aegeria]